jgi:Tfp pilus assembly protein PilN
MLRTNLSTRPFYNERLVQLGLWTAAVVIAALTVFNAVQIRALSLRHGQLLGRVGGDEKRAAQLRADADRARRNVDRAQLETVAAAAREANALIDQRTFSWTELLNRLEATLPDEVRIQSIRPTTDREGRLSVSMVVYGHRAEEMEQFVERLEATGAFQHVYTRTETTTPQGLLEVVIEGRYVPAAAAPRAPAPSTPAAPPREE